MNLEYINIQTNEKLEAHMLEGLKDNAMLKVRPELWTEWDFKKNDELGFNIFGMTKGSEKRAWWICGTCMSKWEAMVNKRANNKNCPYCTGNRVNNTNSLAILAPELAKEWHPTLNKKTPHEITVNSGQKVWWQGSCGHEWEAVVSSRKKGSGCPYCIGQKVNNENSLASKNPTLAKEWSEKNEKSSDEITVNSSIKGWWQGSCGHEWESTVRNRTSGNGCPFCSNKKLLFGFNDMWTTNPELAKLLANSDDGYKHMQSSRAKVDWKCQECNNIIKSKSISDVKSKGLCCPKCSDGISYPEKFAYNLLEELNIDFTRELTSKKFDWVGNKKYDFYIPSLNLILETHGIQHYECRFEDVGGRTLEEELENDFIKRELALSNGIKYYIELDCRESNMEYIRDSILNSVLADVLDLDTIDWEKIGIKSERSLVIKVCDMWNEGMSVGEIAENTSINRMTVRKYILRGDSLGICKYDKKESHDRGVSNYFKASKLSAIN